MHKIQNLVRVSLYKESLVELKTWRWQGKKFFLEKLLEMW